MLIVSRGDMEEVREIRTVCDTQIIIGKDLGNMLADKLKEVSKEGAICIVYDKNLKEIATACAESLRTLGRRIFLRAVDKTIKDSLEVPDFIRYVFAVGCGYAAYCADKIARSLNVGWSIFLTAPTTDTILQGKSPNHVFIDANIIDKCPNVCVASGYGALCAQGLHAFENVFSANVLSKKAGDEIYLETLPTSVDAVSIAVKLLETSAFKTHDDSADIMAKILYLKALKEGKKPRHLGEYKFVSASLLFAFYKELLGAPAIDTLLPAAREREREGLENIGYPLANSVKNIDFFDANGYFRISYILGEYRMDLLDKLESANLRSVSRTWRRIYEDAGFWLKSELTTDDMLFAMRLAGYLSDNLLGYAYAIGMLK